MKIKDRRYEPSPYTNRVSTAERGEIETRRKNKPRKT